MLAPNHLAAPIHCCRVLSLLCVTLQSAQAPGSGPLSRPLSGSCFSPTQPAAVFGVHVTQAVPAVPDHQLCMWQDELHAALWGGGDSSTTPLYQDLPCAASVQARGRRQAPQVSLWALPALQVRSKDMD